MSLVQALILVVLITGTVGTVCALYFLSLKRRPSIRERQYEEEVSGGDDPAQGFEVNSPGALNSVGLPEQSETRGFAASTGQPSVPPLQDRRQATNHARQAPPQPPSESDEKGSSWYQWGYGRYPDLWRNSGDVVIIEPDRERPEPDSKDVTVVDVVIEFSREADKKSILQVTRHAAKQAAPADDHFDPRKFLEDYLAGKIADATWPPLTQCRNPTLDPAHAEAIASGIDTTKDVIHSSLLSWPVNTVGDMVGLPLPFVNIAADMAGTKSLPGDKFLGTAANVIRITGIVIGLATANPVLAVASAKSLAAHEFTHLVKRPCVKSSTVHRAMS